MSSKKKNYTGVMSTLDKRIGGTQLITYTVIFKLFINPFGIENLEDLQYYKFGKKATQKEYDENYKNVKFSKIASSTIISKTIKDVQEYLDYMGAPGTFSNGKLVGNVLTAKYTQEFGSPYYMSTTQFKKYLAEEASDNGVYLTKNAIFTKNKKFIYGYIDFRKLRNIKVTYDRK
jgi:tRNA splicing ligase